MFFRSGLRDTISTSLPIPNLTRNSLIMSGDAVAVIASRGDSGKKALRASRLANSVRNSFPLKKNKQNYFKITLHNTQIFVRSKVVK